MRELSERNDVFVQTVGDSVMRVRAPGDQSGGKFVSSPRDVVKADGMGGRMKALLARAVDRLQGNVGKILA